MGPPFSGLTTCKKSRRGWVQEVLGGSQRQGPILGLQKLALALMGKEPELVREVEKCRHTARALEPASSRGVGLSTTLDLPTVRVRFLLPIHWSPPVSKRVASLRLSGEGTDPDCCLSK